VAVGKIAEDDVRNVEAWASVWAYRAQIGLSESISF
jgi:hypothetical protein